MQRPQSLQRPIPKLRLHKASGNAAVMLDGKYLYLGKYGSPESQERYDRVIADWLAKGRRATGQEQAELRYEKATVEQRHAAEAVSDDRAAVTVNEVLAGFPLIGLGSVKNGLRMIGVMLWIGCKHYWKIICLKERIQSIRGRSRQNRFQSISEMT